MKSRRLIEMVTAAAALMVTGALCVSPAVTRAQRAAAPEKTVRDGVFTEAQAARGKQAYETSTCTRCHLETLEGREQGGGGNGGAALIGLRFIQDFGESKLNKLVGKILVDKPNDNPGTLSPQTALDIAAYILSKNNYPAGRVDLTNEVAAETWIPGPPGATGIANHTIVTSTGCLFKDPSNSWLLKNAANLAPVAPDFSGGGSGAAATNTFRLLDTYNHDAASKEGHTVKVVGYLVRLGAEIRVSLTALQTLAPSCSK